MIFVSKETCKHKMEKKFNVLGGFKWQAETTYKKNKILLVKLKMQNCSAIGRECVICPRISRRVK